MGAAGSAISAKIGSDASQTASQQLQDSQSQVIQNTKDAVAAGQSNATAGTEQSNQLLAGLADQEKNLYTPYANAGIDTLPQIQQVTGEGGPLDQKFSFGQQDLQADPGYQFTLSEGQKAIQRAQAAKGGLFSGATLKSLANYTTNTANTHFDDAFKRAQSTFDENRQTAMSRLSGLQGLANLGFSGSSKAADAVGQLGAQQSRNLQDTGQFNAGLGLRGAENEANAITGKGVAQANGTVGSANQIIGGIRSGTKSIQDFLALRAKQNSGGYSDTSTPPNSIPFGGGSGGDWAGEYGG